MKSFYGQEKILREVESLVESINEDNDYNILFIAPSGYGKTTLVMKILKRLDAIIDNRVEICYPPNFRVHQKKRFHFFDEVHELTSPETFYPFMDRGDRTFFLATNESGLLKEPLYNRCIPLVFEPYNSTDMFHMCSDLLFRYSLEDKLCQTIVERTNLNPRVLKVTCTRLGYIFSNHGIPKTEADLNEILTNILNIDSSGLNAQERRYMEFLSNVGGHASLSHLVYGTRIDRSTILRDIEPGLLYSGKIRITPKGREICQ